MLVTKSNLESRHNAVILSGIFGGLRSEQEPCPAHTVEGGAAPQWPGRARWTFQGSML